jgi:hypothetical protein
MVIVVLPPGLLPQLLRTPYPIMEGGRAASSGPTAVSG